MVAITVEVTGEAVVCVTDWGPVTCMGDVGMQEELEVLTVLNVLIQNSG